MIHLGNINEGSSALIALDFIDEHGSPVTPTSGTWRVDTESGTAIKASTSFTPSSSHHEINVAAQYNAVVNSALKEERHIITVTWTYSTSTGSEEYLIIVKNLRFI